MSVCCSALDTSMLLILILGCDYTLIRLKLKIKQIQKNDFNINRKVLWAITFFAWARPHTSINRQKQATIIYLLFNPFKYATLTCCDDATSSKSHFWARVCAFVCCCHWRTAILKVVQQWTAVASLDREGIWKQQQVDCCVTKFSRPLSPYFNGNNAEIESEKFVGCQFKKFYFCYFNDKMMWFKA